MTLTITLRPALLSDLPLLEHWDQQPHVIASSPNEVTDWETVLEDGEPYVERFIAMIGETPIGFLMIIDPANEESHYWGEVPENLRAVDIWIGEAEHLNKGYGTQMMNLAFERCFSDPEVTGILIDPLSSNTDAIRFYQRLGFKFVEERWFDKDLCAVHLLERGIWDS